MHIALFIVSVLVFLGCAYLSYYQYITAASRFAIWVTAAAASIWFADILLAAARL